MKQIPFGSFKRTSCDWAETMAADDLNTKRHWRSFAFEQISWNQVKTLNIKTFADVSARIKPVAVRIKWVCLLRTEKNQAKLVPGCGNTRAEEPNTELGCLLSFRLNSLLMTNFSFSCNQDSFEWIFLRERPNICCFSLSCHTLKTPF